ncbi:MAG TPA: ABC transporter permease [Gemmatimonadaceae bacterium]|nr:ABC transporter permease [Gemmatimonadaceae bacterium]
MPNSFWRRRSIRESELTDELRTHMSMAIRDGIARGESPEDAERNARRDLGDTVTIREVTSDMWPRDWASEFAGDVRYAIRSLTRLPAFATACVVTLALGIGANTAIFSVINGVVLRPLPYPKPQQLVQITSQFPSMGLDHFPLDAAEFLEFQERNRSFQSVGAYVVSAVNLGGDATPMRVTAAIASSSMFDVLGVHPAMGRAFTNEETLPNQAPVVVLSHEVWQSAFGGRPIVGKQIQVDGMARTVVGIMPPGFDVHEQGVQVWAPLTLDPAQRKQYRGGHNFLLVGRLKDGVSLTQARGELTQMVKQWNVTDGGTVGAQCCGPGFVHTPDPKFHPIRFDDLQSDTIGGIGRALWTLQAAVAFVLLIACANLANLLLMRAETRHKELAVRAALGAGRGRLVRQFLAESFVLSITGAVLGTALAYVGLRTLVHAASAGIPRAAGVTIDARVLLFTLGLALLTAVVFGLAPALQMTAGNLGLTLRDAGSRTTAIGARARVRSGLVILEMALAVMLVVGAGLLVRSFWNLMRVDAGFDRTHLTTFRIALPPKVYTDPVRRVAFYDNLTRELRSVPGIAATTAMSGLPPQRSINANDTDIEGYVPAPNGPMANIDYYQYALPSYFTTMHIPVVAGRAFGPQDGPMTAPVAIINQTTARLFYGKQNPIGRRIRPGGDSVWMTIVGVAKDVKQGGVDSKTGTELYLDYEQSPTIRQYAPASLNVVVRSDRDVAALAPGIRKVVSSLDASLPIAQMRSMDEVFAASVARPQILAELLGTFAVIALVLAAVGTYGVLAYSITQRAREIGIRIALGASAQNVRRMVLRHGLGLAVVGLALGLLGAAALGRLTSTLLFGIAPVDTMTYVAVSAFMLCVAGAASFVPALRATRMDPLEALRAD